MTKAELIKPQKLNRGDMVACITLSWGGAAEYPERYAQGKKQLEQTFGLQVVETPNALKDAKWISEHPKERLSDLIWAFENKKIKAIFTIIGGDDSVLLLKHLTSEHLNIIRRNPKIFVGFSDTTTINFICLKAGIVSFYGPTVLFGIAENGGMHEYTVEYLKKALFSTKPIGDVVPSKEGWTIDRIPWTIEGNRIKRRMQKSAVFNFLQGKGVIEGKLMGGCLDTLEVIKNTVIWPPPLEWDGAILFVETSEEKPTPELVEQWLNNYGERGILEKLNGIIFGIPGGDIPYDDSEYESRITEHIKIFDQYDAVFKKVTQKWGKTQLPIVTRVNFGHTCPMLTLPMGGRVKIDSENKKISILDSGVNE